MRKIFSILIITISFLFIGNVDALTYARVTNKAATTWAGPGTNYSKSVVLKYNDVVPLYNTTILKSERSCPEGFYKANINGKTSYVCKHDVSTSNVSVKVSSSEINIRKGAGTKYGIYQSTTKNMLYTLEGTTKYKGSGCTSGWYRLNLNTSTDRYICSSLTNSYNSSTNVIITNKNGSPIKKNSSSTSGNTASLKYGQAVTLYETKKYSVKGCSRGLYKILYGNTVRYICSNSVVRTNNIYLVNDLSGVNIRSKASSSSSKITYLSYMEPVMVTSTSKVKGSGCSSGWYKININNKTAYVCSAYVSSSSNSTTTNTSTTIRKSASASSSAISTITKGKYVILQNTTRNSGSGCSNGWYKISIDGGTGYVCSDHTEFGKNTAPKAVTNTTTSTTSTTTTTNSTSSTVKKINTVKTSSGNYYTTNTWTYRLKENYGYVRKSASASSALQDTLYLGTEMEVLSSSAAGNGCSSGWYKIKYYNNKTGYICKSLVEKYSDVTKNDAIYCNTLKNAGFPASYCPYLSYLHSKHPSWVFKPEKTGVTFLAAINGESEKNYTQHTVGAYLTSSAVREAGGWKTASDGYVAYMLDPRNYLNEQNIFAFENLSYDSKYHTLSTIKSIVSGTYLNNDTYGNYFLSAGKTYNVSPVHLAARVKQEGGSDSSYSAVSGNASGSCSFTSYVCSSYVSVSGTKGTITSSVNLRSGAGTNNYIISEGQINEVFTLASTTKYKGTGCSSGWYKINLTRSLKGIYNYYNIGAYGSNPVNRGLQAAAGCVDSNDGTPWNSREKAIKYGASFIANGYINKGQDTMYYQKFNTGPNATATRYTHQYMTNILAPASESLSTYDSYNSLKLLDKAYVFKIPVYNSMPSDFTTHPPVK